MSEQASSTNITTKGLVLEMLGIMAVEMIVVTHASSLISYTKMTGISWYTIYNSISIPSPYLLLEGTAITIAAIYILYRAGKLFLLWMPKEEPDTEILDALPNKWRKEQQ